MFDYILHPKFRLKNMVPSHVQMPPIAPVCSVPLKHAAGMLKCACSHPDVLTASRHHSQLLTMMIKKRLHSSMWRSNFDFLISFYFGLISFYSVLSYDRKMKQKEKEDYRHFILNYSLYEHQTWVFYLIPQVATSLFPEM